MDGAFLYISLSMSYLYFQRMRQYEIRKKLDELYKIELVNKVRSERGGKSKEELYALLSPRRGGARKKNRRSVKSAAVTSSEKEMTKLPEINFDERTRLLKYEVSDIFSSLFFSFAFFAF